MSHKITTSLAIAAALGSRTHTSGAVGLRKI
jgi:hypothetical protein